MNLLEALEVLKQASIDRGETIVIRGNDVTSIKNDSVKGNILTTLDEMMASVENLRKLLE